MHIADIPKPFGELYKVVNLCDVGQFICLQLFKFIAYLYTIHLYIIIRATEITFSTFSWSLKNKYLSRK